MSLITKYEFEAPREGIELLILAAVHGNETAGTKACNRLIAELNADKITLKNGFLTLVPVCNPEAYRKDIRCVEENLNRVVMIHERPQTYEQRLANEICPLIQRSQITLDLHSTHCFGDVPFAFCDYPDEYNRRLIDALDVDYVLEGWPDIYGQQQQIQDYSTEHCAHFYGKTATTLECGYHKAPEAADLAYRAIIGTLATFGLIEGNVPSFRNKQRIKMNSFIIKERDGSLCRAYKHLDKISRGEKLAVYDDGEILYAPDDGYILLPNLKAELGTEWYYLGSAL